MTKDEREWLKHDDPQNLYLMCHDKVSQRKWRLFGVACCHRISSLITDERSLNAVLVAERFADAQASERQLQAAAKKAIKAFKDDGNFPLALRACEQVCSEQVDPYSLAQTAANAAQYAKEMRAEDALKVAIAETKEQSLLLRDIIGNPFRKPPRVKPEWFSETVVALAAGIYSERAFDRMPILADALEDAGCDNNDILNHCRVEGPHARGCWVVDLILGKE